MKAETKDRLLNTVINAVMSGLGYWLNSRQPKENTKPEQKA